MRDRTATRQGYLAHGAQNGVAFATTDLTQRSSLHRLVSKDDILWFRRPLTITSRTSSVTNGFVQAIIPSVEPTPEETEEALAVLGMTRETIECVYCGSPATDWDHLNPLVRGKRPTGYINEIRNLVPSCGPCNQSKSGADWRRWIDGKARNSPRTKEVADLPGRIARLERFVAWAKVAPLSLRALAGEELWDAYWQRLAAIEQAMKEAQVQALLLQQAIRQSLERKRSSHVTFEQPMSTTSMDES